MTLKTLRSAMPVVAVGFGLLTTVAWMGFLGLGAWALAEWTLIKLADLIL